MNITDLTRQVQVRVGVRPDGLWGLDTVRAVLAALPAHLRSPEPPTGVRRISQRGLELIKSFEGLRLTAYLCPAGVPTVGYGSTGPHVRLSMKITEAEAEKLLREDLDRFERAISRLAPNATQGQHDAMVSLAFNVGAAAIEKSTLLRKHNAGDYAVAAAEFAKWNKAGGRELTGLTRRRAAEAELYRS